MAGSINSHCETQVAALTTGQWAQLTSPQVRRRACTDVSFLSALPVPEKAGSRCCCLCTAALQRLTNSHSAGLSRAKHYACNEKANTSQQVVVISPLPQIVLPEPLD